MFKRAFAVILLLFAFALRAEAAQVTVSQLVIGNWQGTDTGVELRIFADETFIANPGGDFIASGFPPNNGVYKIFACTVNTGAKTLTIASGTLFSTTDGRDRQTSRYSAYLFSTTTGQQIQSFLLQFRLAPTPTTQSWEDIRTFNSSGAPIPIDRDTYTKTQINQIIQDLMDSFMTSGIVQPLAGGTGANLSGTGGANQFVRQNSVGGAFTVSAIADADVPDTITVSNYQLLSGKNASGGYAGLDGSTKISSSQLPNGLSNYTVTGLSTGRTFTFPDSDAAVAAGTPTAGGVPVGTGSAFSITRTPSIGSVTTDQQAAIVVQPYSTSAGNTGEIRLLELAANGSNFFAQRAPDSITADRVLVWPSADPTPGQYIAASISGSVITLSYNTPAAPAGGYNLIKVDGSSLGGGSPTTTLNFLGATAAGAIGGVGPFVGDTGGGAERVALRTSPDNSTIVVGSGRTISTTAPLAGGGDLSANRTLSISVSPGAATTVVGVTRALAVSGGPLTIGGGASADLSADRTIAIATSPGSASTVVGTGRTLSSSGGTLSGTGDLSADRDIAVVANKTKQRVGVRNNAGTTVGTRANVQFLNTATVTATVTDSGGGFDDGATDQVTVAFDVMSSSSSHNLLSSTHSDTTVGSPTKGNLIGADGSTWKALAVGADGLPLVANSGASLGVNYAALDISNTANVSGALPISRGGSGQATALLAFNALSPLSAAGDLLTRDSTNNIRLPIGTALQGLRVNAGGTALEYADITATSATNPLTTSDKQAFKFLPAGFESAATPVAYFTSATATPTRLVLVNKAYICRVYLDRKTRFTHLAARYLSTTAGVKFSFAIYSADGSSRKVYSDVFTTAATPGSAHTGTGGTGNYIAAPSGTVGADTVLSGSAVSAGIATLDEGYYIFGWTVSAAGAVGFSGVSISTTAGISNLFSAGGSASSAALSTNPSLTGEDTVSTTLGAMPSSITTILGRDGSGSLEVPLIKLYSGN